MNEAHTSTSPCNQGIGRGLIVYLSFKSGASRKEFSKIAKSLVNLPVLTVGNWGDGSGAISLIDLIRKEGEKNEASENGCGGSVGGDRAGLMLIPQAALVARVRGLKDLKYYDQLSKGEAKEFYYAFAQVLRTELLSALDPEARKRREILEYKKRAQAKKDSGPVLPSLYFQTGDWAGKYSAYDERGVPTHDREGARLKKKQRKKLERLYSNQVKKHEKALAKAKAALTVEAAPATAAVRATAAAEAAKGAEKATGIPSASEMKLGAREKEKKLQQDSKGNGAVNIKEENTGVANDAASSNEVTSQQQQRREAESPSSKDKTKLPHYKVVIGTFGNRQGLRVNAECGPFTHTFDF